MTNLAVCSFHLLLITKARANIMIGLNGSVGDVGRRVWFRRRFFYVFRRWA
jgi:hypothetical protein